MAVLIGLCLAALQVAPADSSLVVGYLRQTIVSDAAQLRDAIAAAKPGDVIAMKDGTWTDVDIRMDTAGIPGAPITLRAVTPGAVTLNGTSTLTFAAPHVRVEGLHFRGGALTQGAVVRFASDHGTFTHSAISDYNRVGKNAILRTPPPDPPRPLGPADVGPSWMRQ